jgi:hypothetical protein
VSPSAEFLHFSLVGGIMGSVVQLHSQLQIVLSGHTGHLSESLLKVLMNDGIVNIKTNIEIINIIDKSIISIVKIGGCF